MLEKSRYGLFSPQRHLQRMKVLQLRLQVNFVRIDTDLVDNDLDQLLGPEEWRQDRKSRQAFHVRSQTVSGVGDSPGLELVQPLAVNSSVELCSSLGLIWKQWCLVVLVSML